MLITIVSFISLVSTISAASVSEAMLTDMNVLRNAKDRGRCSFKKSNWSSYCECRMNSDDPIVRKVVGRISGDGCSVIPKLCSLLIKTFAISLTTGILSVILFFAGLLIFCNPLKEYISVDGDNKDRDEQQQQQHHQQPRPLPNSTDAPPAYNSIGSYNPQYQTQYRGYSEGHQGYAIYTAQQPMYGGAAGATAGPSAPPVQDVRSQKEEKRRLVDH